MELFTKIYTNRCIVTRGNSDLVFALTKMSITHATITHKQRNGFALRTVTPLSVLPHVKCTYQLKFHLHKNVFSTWIKKNKDKYYKASYMYINTITGKSNALIAVNVQIFVATIFHGLNFMGKKYPTVITVANCSSV